MQFDRLAAETAGTLYNSDKASHSFRGVTIDSRSISAGELFVAIRGERYDGHDFIPVAVKSGAAGVIARLDYPGLMHLPGTVGVIAVDDPHQAMLTMARHHRQRLSSFFVGITGSNGKTTTKELTFRLLAAISDKVFCSPGNLNNLYGVPLAIFRIPEDTEYSVLEIGISTTSEMPILADVVDPDVVVITNVGATHLENLGSVTGVARAKLELVRRARAGVPVILNGDDDILMSEARQIKNEFVTFAINNDASYRPTDIATDSAGVTQVTIEGHRFILSLPGHYQVYNLLAAYAVVRSLGLGFDGIDTAAISLETAPMRGQVHAINDIHFVADCYNANPESMRVGLEAFFTGPDTERRIAVLGDMLELGTGAENYHYQVGRQLAGYDFTVALLVGPMARHILTGACEAGAKASSMITYDDAEQAAEGLVDILRSGDRVYLKASRGIGLERVLERFRQAGEKP